MSDVRNSENAFDPWAEWLGIPTADQPPHHYRLLNLKLFEDDSAAIERAADERMAAVRRHQTGPRAAATQQVLNRLSAAKQCLLNPATRGAYDAVIRGQIAAKQSAAAKLPQAELVEQPPSVEWQTPPVEAAFDFAASMTADTTRRAATTKRAKGGPRLIVVAGVLLSLVTACAAVYVLFMPDDSEPQKPRVIVIERPAPKSKAKAVDEPPVVRPEGQILHCTAENVAMADVHRRDEDLLDLTVAEGRVEVSWTVRVRQAGFYAPSITYSAVGESAQTFELELADETRRTTPIRPTAGAMATDDLKAIVFKKTGDQRVILRAAGTVDRSRVIKVRELTFKPLSLPDPVKTVR